MISKFRLRYHIWYHKNSYKSLVLSLYDFAYYIISIIMHVTSSRRRLGVKFKLILSRSLPGPARGPRSPASVTLPTFDIEGRTFDILILRYRRCNLRYRRSENDLRYRVRYDNSISTKTLILKKKLRYPYIPTLHRNQERHQGFYLRNLRYPYIPILQYRDIRYLTRYWIKTSTPNTNWVYKKRRNLIPYPAYPISKDFIRYRYNIECTKSVLLERPQYRT